MKDLVEATYILGIKIHKDESERLLGPSQKVYTEKVLEKFWMKDYTPSITPIIKGDMFSQNQYPQNALEKEKMINSPYAFTVGSWYIYKFAQDPTSDLQ